MTLDLSAIRERVERALEISRRASPKDWLPRWSLDSVDQVVDLLPALARDVMALTEENARVNIAHSKRKIELAKTQALLAQADAIIAAKFQPFGAKPKPNSISAEHLSAALKRHFARQSKSPTDDEAEALRK